RALHVVSLATLQQQQPRWRRFPLLLLALPLLIWAQVQALTQLYLLAQLHSIGSYNGADATHPRAVINRTEYPLVLAADIGHRVYIQGRHQYRETRVLMPYKLYLHGSHR